MKKSTARNRIKAILARWTLAGFLETVSALYYLGLSLSRPLLFLGAWGACVELFGVWGLVLGWVPSTIFALLACWLWPLGVAVLLWALWRIVAV